MQVPLINHHAGSADSILETPRVGDWVLEPGTHVDHEAERIKYREVSRHEGMDEDEPNPLPVWVSATLLVAYCAVFWVGAITIGGWFWETLTTGFMR